MILKEKEVGSIVKYSKNRMLMASGVPKRKWYKFSNVRIKKGKILATYKLSKKEETDGVKLFIK